MSYTTSPFSVLFLYAAIKSAGTPLSSLAVNVIWPCVNRFVNLNAPERSSLAYGKVELIFLRGETMSVV